MKPAFSITGFSAPFRMTGKERLRIIAFVKAICRATHKKAGLKGKI
jgi:hypothetical protein